MSVPRLLTWSAPTSEGAGDRTDEVAARLDDCAPADLPRLARDLAADPGHEHRRAVVVTDPVRAAQRLRERDPRHVLTGEARPDRPVVFLCSGVGDHYPGLGAGLYRHLPGYAAALTRCLDRLDPDLGSRLRAVLLPRPRDRAEEAVTTRRDLALTPVFGARDDAGPVHDTLVAQPLLFAVQYALAEALQALGVRPSALLGYSIGEYVAGCVAGVLPLPGMLDVVARRARLVAGLPRGGMLAVMSGPEPLLPFLGDGVCLAAEDGPELTVLAGPDDALAPVAAALAGRGIASHRLPATHAFHSTMMEPVVSPLRELLAAAPLRGPRIPLLSNGTGTWMRQEATDPGYWAGQLCRTVRFADDLTVLWSLPDPVLVELGPGPALGRLALRSPARPRDRTPVVVAALPGPLERRPDLVALLTALGRLWTAGVPVDLVGLQRGIR